MTGQHGGGVALADDSGDYDTGTYVAATAARNEAAAEALIAAHGHARPRPRRWFRLPRKQAPAPVSQLLESACTDEPGEFTQAVDGWQSPVTGAGALERPAVATGTAHEDPEPTQAMLLHEVPDLITYPAPSPRPFIPDPAVAPPAAVSWGPWDDEPGSPEPMQRYVPDLPADLTECPAFRETLAASAPYARECLSGCRIDGGTWGQRMVSAGICLYSVPTYTVAAFAAVSDAEAAGFESVAA